MARKGKRPLGEVFREAKQQAKVELTESISQHNKEELSKFDTALNARVKTLGADLAKLAKNPDKGSHLTIKIARPDMGLRAIGEPGLDESEALEALVKFCEQENVSVTIRNEQVSAGLTNRSQGRGTRPKMVSGVVITINPGNEFDGLVWERHRTGGRRHGRNFD